MALITALRVKGAEMETDNGQYKGTETDNPFEDEAEKTEANKSLGREELKAKYTGKQLADLVVGKTPLKLSTLQRMSKDDLIDIYLDIDTKKKSNNARASRSTGETEDILNFGLATLQSIKQARENDPTANINQIALNMFKSSAVKKIDDARQSEAISNDTLQNVIFYLAGGALVVDAVVGFKNVPSLFGKLKDKVKRKSANDTK